MIRPGFTDSNPKGFKSIHIVGDRNDWAISEKFVSKESDLVLTLDFALKKQLEESDFKVWYLDQLAEPSILQRYNFEMHDFLDQWHEQAYLQGVLNGNGYNLGEAIKLHILNDTTLFCHYFFNCLCLEEIEYEELLVCAQDEMIPIVLNSMKIDFKTVEGKIADGFSTYYFPITKWVNERIKKSSFRNRLGHLLKLLLDVFNAIVTPVRKRSIIYFQEYYPTASLISFLAVRKDISIITPDYNFKRKILGQRRLTSLYTEKKGSKDINPDLAEVAKLIKPWQVGKHKVDAYLTPFIFPVLQREIKEIKKLISKVNANLTGTNLKLVVPVTEYWIENNLVIQFARNHKIPVFMVANGLLNFAFENDGKKADFLNCYGEAITEDYLKNSNQGVSLGDPRMDSYASLEGKEVNREMPTITIGAAGYNNIDLNSYLAFEYDFLCDILEIISDLRLKGYKNKVLLKVRTNGYSETYTKFINEYFSNLDVRVERDVPFSEVLKETDLYISIYSQTLFESSMMGIPAIYFKKDSQFMNRPFDGNCELVTAYDKANLQELIVKFYDHDPVFDDFLKKEIMSKYVGPLDGRNTERNVSFIDELLVRNSAIA